MQHVGFNHSQLFYYRDIKDTLHGFCIFIVIAPISLKSSYFVCDTIVKFLNKVESIILYSITANFWPTGNWHIKMGCAVFRSFRFRCEDTRTNIGSIPSILVFSHRMSSSASIKISSLVTLILTNTVSWSSTKRYKGVRMTLSALFRCKTLRIKLFWIREIGWITM